ncbi:hypothetical protein NIES4073_02630 (plasmid) [Kalymmatonema gypsitolerans NIES-4073]|nr:hypothetical protein NIES4073_02630 [Scytonema sp. NIES-4073]
MTYCGDDPNRNEWNLVDLSISERLQPLRDYLCDENVLVRALPDVAAGFGERVESGDIYHLIRAGRAVEEENRDADNRVTAEVWTLLLVIMLPHRYTSKGLYDALKKARDLLIGFKPPYATSTIRASTAGWQFKRDESQWIVESNFEFDINILEHTDITPDITPMITEVTINTATMTEVVT